MVDICNVIKISRTYIKTMSLHFFFPVDTVYPHICLCVCVFVCCPTFSLWPKPMAISNNNTNNNKHMCTVRPVQRTIIVLLRIHFFCCCHCRRRCCCYCTESSRVIFFHFALCVRVSGDKWKHHSLASFFFTCLSRSRRMFEKPFHWKCIMISDIIFTFILFFLCVESVALGWRVVVVVLLLLLLIIIKIITLFHDVLLSLMFGCVVNIKTEIADRHLPTITSSFGLIYLQTANKVFARQLQKCFAYKVIVIIVITFLTRSPFRPLWGLDFLKPFLSLSNCFFEMVLWKFQFVVKFITWIFMICKLKHFI